MHEELLQAAARLTTKGFFQQSGDSLSLLQPGSGLMLLLQQGGEVRQVALERPTDNLSRLHAEVYRLRGDVGAVADDHRQRRGQQYADQPEALAALLAWAGLHGAAPVDLAARREADLNRLADSLEAHLDLARLAACFGPGAAAEALCGRLA